MREVRPGTFLINAKGKQVRVTNVYFSRESTVMVQISTNCHATITHPMVDTKAHGRSYRSRRHTTKTIVTAAEWHTRRRNNTYRSTPMGSPPFQPLDFQVGLYLHPSSPQNLRKSGDMWGFSTEHNQPVRSFDYPSCLICPIGHTGWAQVDIAAAILSCWGRTRHLPDPRPDLVEFQEQTEAIYAFLSNPGAVQSLEKKHRTTQHQLSAAPFQKDKQPIEFTNGHVQLEWVRGKWSVRNWKDNATSPPSWIQPEENFLSALIRSPSRPEPIAPEHNLEANLDRLTINSPGLPYRPLQDKHLQEQAMAGQKWPHPNTTTMVLYLQKMKWRTPFMRRLRSISIQWKMAIDSLEYKDFDLSSCCQGEIQPRDSHRLGLIRDGHLICHNRRAYETLKMDAVWVPDYHTPDRGIGLSGAQMLNNLQLIPPALRTLSPFRDSLVHLNISGCQSINKSAIDTLLRLSQTHLPKLQHIHMEGLRLELCHQAAKSFLREKLGKFDSLGTMGAFTLGQDRRTGVYMDGQDLSAKHLIHWLKVDSTETWNRIYQATNISNPFPGGPPVQRQHDNPNRAVPFNPSANLFNMPQTGMFREEDGTLRVPKWNCTLSGTPLEPELDPMDTAGLPQITTPWSENETKIMNQLFPYLDFLCLNFGRTGVFQWNDPNSSTLKHTTQWPQRIAGDLPRRFNQKGITSTRTDPQPHMPYFIFRNMSPHFDCYANSGIPDIKGTEHHFYSWDEGDKKLQLLHLLPHLQLSDVATGMEHRIDDLQTLAKSIIDRMGRRPPSHPNHSTTQRLTQLNENLLQHERRKFGIAADNVINILCKTDPPVPVIEGRLTTSATDYLGYPIGGPGSSGVDTWGSLNRSESGWGNWFGIIAQVCKS